MADPVGVADQLVFLEPAFVDHVVVLDPGDGDREFVACEFLDDVRIGKQGDGLRLPLAPRLGGDELLGLVVAGQPAVVSGDEVVALRLRDRIEELLPLVREDLGRAVMIEPVQLGLAEGEDAAKDQFGDPLGMGLGVSQSQSRTPGPAIDHPAFDPELGPEPLDIVDQVPGRVGLERGVRRRTAAAPLVEQEHVVELRIELAAMVRAAAGARSAVEEDDRLGAGRSAPFPVKLVAVADVDPIALIGLDLGIKGPARARVVRHQKLSSS